VVFPGSPRIFEAQPSPKDPAVMARESPPRWPIPRHSAKRQKLPRRHHESKALENRNHHLPQDKHTQCTPANYSQAGDTAQRTDPCFPPPSCGSMEVFALFYHRDEVQNVLRAASSFSNPDITSR